MPEHRPEPVRRPPADRPLSGSTVAHLLGGVAGWVRWFGPGRVAATTLGLTVLGLGVIWAVRAPAPSAVQVGDAAVALARPDLPPVTLVGADPPTPEELWVHVAGRVGSPGVHRVAPGSRVTDALDAAGGPLADAELDALNLAAPVGDGQRIHVPRVGEVVVGPVAVGETAAAVAAGPVDVNRANEAELQALPGVGPATAAAIVEDRERHGPFGGPEELLRVRGIGPAKLDAMRDLVAT